jgi:WD40 repeat protein
LSDIRNGTRVGVYKVLGILGRGGMGAVYRAQDEKLGRLVAMKVIARELAHSPVVRERFLREAAAAGAVSHPSVIAIYGLGEHEGSPYIVFEYLPGGTLADRLARVGRLPWREAATLGATLARGLAAVHAVGLVHRDMKPENVLFDALGNPKLSDFGLVRAREKEGALTKTGELIGTLAYMAPEQAESSHVDARADLYGLGAILYAALTGERPFAGEGYEVLKRVLVEMPVPVREREPGVPAALERLVMTLLSKDPALRGEGALAIAAELDAIAGETGPASPGGRGLLVAGALGVAALTATLVLLVVPTRDKHPQTGPQKDPGTAPVATAATVVHVSSAVPPVNPVVVANPGGDGSTVALLATWGIPELAHHHPGTNRRQGVAHGVAFLASGALVASCGFDGAVRVWNPDTGALVASFANRESLLDIAVSADATRIVAGGDVGTAKVFDVPRGVDLATLTGHVKKPVYGIAISPDGSRVLTAGGDTTVRLWDAGTGAELARFDGPVGAWSVAFSPDGKLGIAGWGDGTLQLIDVALGKRQGVAMRDPTARMLSVAFSPDGKRVVSTSAESTAAIWDLETRTRIAVLEGHTAEVRSVAFMPDGRAVTASFDGTVRVWDGPTCLQVLARHRDKLSGVAVSPDGARIATSAFDGTVRVWDVASGAELGAPYGHRVRVLGLEPLEDGKRLVTTSAVGPFRVFDIASGEELSPPAPQGTGAVAVSRDLSHAILAVAGKSVSLLDVASKTETRLEVTAVPVHAVFTPDGKRAVTTSEGPSLKVWDVATQALVRSIPVPGPADDRGRSELRLLQLLPDGRALTAGAADASLKIWDLDSGTLMTTIANLREKLFVHAAPVAGGERIVTSDHDQRVAIHDVALAARGQASEVATLAILGDRRLAPCLAVSPDGGYVLTGSSDGVRVWSLESRVLLTTVPLHGELPHELAFARDGRSFFVATDRNVIRRYSFDPRRR